LKHLMTSPPALATRPRLVTTSFVLVTLSTFAYFLTLGVLLPVVPLYVEEDLGGGAISVGFAVGAFAASAALFRPVVGRLGDERGRRLLIVGGALVVALSVAGYVAASTIVTLVLLRLVSGIGEAAMFVGAATSIQDMATDDRRGEAASYFSLALYGGLALGPPIGEVLFRRHGADTVWLAAGGAALVSALLGLRTPVGRLVPRGSRERRAFLHPDAVLPGVVLFLGLVGFAGYAAFVPGYAKDIGLSGTGPLFSLYAGLILAVRLGGARLPDRLGSRWATSLSLVAIAGGLGVMGVFATPLGLYAGTVVFSLGMALLFPAMFSAVMHAAPEEERSHAVGTFSLFFDLSQGIGAVILGGVVALSGERGAFLAGALMALVGLGLLRQRVAPRPVEEG
jgi:MFS family permease